MKILAIETSCDETAIAILECTGDPVKLGSHGAGEQNATFTVLGNALISQIEIHKEYGGVFPALAKREHAKNLVPILEAALEEAELLHEDMQVIPEETRAKISEILAREPGLSEAFFEFISECETPEIDAIAVTAGPGLEPALWVGINFAKALALVWSASRRMPLVAVNHMEGHILAALARQEAPLLRQSFGGQASTKHDPPAGGPNKFQTEKLEIRDVAMPVLALLISGGHTELVLMKEWLKYQLIGQTRDDAVGEAYDKVARMLGLPYPGGPELSRLAELSRTEFQDVVRPTSDVGRTTSNTWAKLPRPMIDSGTCDFSFAGLKTAVLYLLKDKPALNEKEKQHLAHEFENVIADVLWKKTELAIQKTSPKTLVLGGGVSANTHIRRVFKEQMVSNFPATSLQIPVSSLSTDNAIMIAIAGYYRVLQKSPPAGRLQTDIIACGNLTLDS